MARFRQVYGGKWHDSVSEIDDFGLSFDGAVSVTADPSGVDVNGIPASELKCMVLACIERLKAIGEWEDG